MNAVFVMSAAFPFGEAFSSRARNITKLFCSVGYHVHIICPISKNDKDAPELCGYDYSVERVRDPKNIITLSGIGTAKPYMNALYNYVESHLIDILISSSMVFVNDELYSFCRSKGIPYIVEQCEWYDSSTFKGGRFNPYYREHIKLINKKNKRANGVIAISRLFQEYYVTQKVPTVRIPTILDVENTFSRIDFINRKTIHIIFAGSVGKGKEKFKPIFQALQVVNNNNIKIVMDIYGADENQILSNIDGDKGLLESVGTYVNINGRIPQDEIEEKVREADFSIFIRPVRRSSNAGFPTKLAESFAVGTPVISNDTGDISLYLHNGENGFIVNNDSKEELLSVFNKMIVQENEQYNAMRRNARNTAEEYFDFRIYGEKLLMLLREI